MSRRVRVKWRPPLWLVLAGPLAVVFALPILGIGYFRLAGGILGWLETVQIITVTAALLVIILAILMWRLVYAPVWKLTRYARAVIAAEPATFPARWGTSEFARLGRAVEEMSRVLQGREAVVTSYADHVTHEVRTPLTTIQGAAELLSDPDLPADERAKLMELISGAAARMSDLIDAQRAFARAADPAKGGQCLVSDALPDGATLGQDGTVALPLQVLSMVLGHLVTNARDHGATQVVVSADADGLTVADNGAGISAGNRDRVFDPFFTTRRDAGGTGMGLAIVRRMLQAQGAEITLDDSATGAVFRISV